MNKQKVRVKINARSDTAYLALPGHPRQVTPSILSKSIGLSTILNYEGPDINLDFNLSELLIGIEILVYPSRYKKKLRIPDETIRMAKKRSKVYYIKLPHYEAVKGRNTKSIRLEEIIDNYDGPLVNLDFFEKMLIGIAVTCVTAQEPG